ncbi:MAG: glucosamine 6-phosphate synthetase [Opitutae bacterium]|nr:glucosamine 6-phosphate synthetase [Opitutae bacterium]
MCGIFGFISETKGNYTKDVRILAKYAQQRGRDSSGVVICGDEICNVSRSDSTLLDLLRKVDFGDSYLTMGHSRLVTDGMHDNQPIVRDGIVTLHNGIVVNADELWETTKQERNLTIDTEIIPALMSEYLSNGVSVKDAAGEVLKKCKGVVSAAILMPMHGCVLLMTNNGSLYTGNKNGTTFFSSEEYPLLKISCDDISAVPKTLIIDINKSSPLMREHQFVQKSSRDLLPSLQKNSQQESLLVYDKSSLRRCSCCVLPETMPFIRFGEDGVCNYCHNYKSKNKTKPISVLRELVEPYKRSGKPDCIIPFSGGRDSSYSLHLAVEELGMRPITYTYDWGMVTDLARRNISRMCSALNVENIIVAADIEKKRDNIRKNLSAWLQRPHLGMLSVLTAGDKHFFQHVETVKKQTGIGLNLWGVNPLEVTHFKAGFLGIPPAFEEELVYSQGIRRQLRYQFNRTFQYLRNPGYLNGSLYDTISGEYWRSIHKKTDYFHLFDYFSWEEQESDRTLDIYDWEKAPDTKTTWRIGDGTAAFYNYAYYTIAGFTEHDTFRSNQIREGQLTRLEALELIEEENRPRYQNIRWYLDAVGIDFEYAIKTINQVSKLY